MSARRVGALALAAMFGACSSSSSSPRLVSESGGASATTDDGGDGGDAGAAGAATVESIVVFDDARISSLDGTPNFQELAADVDWSGGPYQSATLIADLKTTCVPFSTWAINSPPAGQNWPADCDAFDRNFEISLEGSEQRSGAGKSSPGLELVRAITPFGGPLRVERDLTAIVNARPKGGRMHARIPTFADPAGLVTGSAAGWNVSLRVELVRGAPGRRPLAVIPLFYGDVTSAVASSAPFTTPKGTRTAFLEYRTTGHGQAAGDAFSCNGPAEEFCKRQHTLKLDGAMLKAFTPWESCAARCTLSKTKGPGGLAYCTENPCGAVASVKAARANWCPGTETLPVVIDAPALAAPGAHVLSWQVSNVAEGGSVRVSLTYFAFGD